VRREEIRPRRLILPSDLRKNSTFALNPDMWDKFVAVEWNTRCCANFLSNDEFDYGPTPGSRSV
jgi:hypothetical protein